MTRHAHAESLERRTHLSTTVKYDGQKLEIRGDKEAGAVFVRAPAGILLVDANGETQVLGPAAGLEDVVIRSLRAFDRVGVEDTDIGDSLVIDSGNDRDIVIVRRTNVGTDMTINSRGGDDDLVLRDIRAGDTVEVNTGPGDDLVAANNFNAENDIVIELGEGDDVLFANDPLVAGDLVILDGGPGQDTLIVHSSTLGSNTEIRNFEVIEVITP